MKLITKAIEKAFQKQGSTAEMNADEIKIVMKLFNPTGGQTWYIYEMEDDGDTMWCFANLGDPMFAECGTVSFNELKQFRGRFGLGIERDMHFDPLSMTLKEVQDKVQSGKHV